MDNNDANKSETALREEKILEFWKDNNIFQKSLTKESPEGEFVFYEGPPTANGKPGIHHLEARAFKDAIPRYKTMRGYHVARKGGWDTHGLPVELQVEKKLGLNSKKAIEEYGIAKFNQECKESVWEYLDIWNKFTKRIGYWVDQENAYVTYHNNYIESVWNVVKKVNEQNLLYKDYKVVPWCPRCGTALSSHELAQGYEDVKDLSVYVKFKVVGQENTYILAWTTTPWTLPGNVALAVGENIDYIKVEKNNELLILAKARLGILEGEYKIIQELKGKSLINLEYEPLFPYFSDTISGSEKEKLGKAFKVYGADFVTTEDGTGVVHTALMYGQDDFVLGTQIGLPKHHLVNPEGKFIKGTGFLEGRFVKEKDENGKPTLDVDIIKYLTDKNLFFNKENYQHSYPHCWRCKTALIYYARDSWYIKMSDPKIKEKMIEENKSINWEPAHIREGRFGEWLREIKDWAISRERYWGTPLPVWICESCKKIEVMGGLDEIKEKTKKSGNKYFVMRHGGAESNLKGRICSKIEDEDHLTEEGKKQVLNSIPEIKDKKIDLIISSDFMRTKETVEIIKQRLGFKEENTLFDKRLWELSAGVFDGKLWGDYWNEGKNNDFYSYRPEGGESHNDVKLRTVAFLYDIEKRYKDKNILIITHEAPARMLMVGIQGLDNVEALNELKTKIISFKNAEVAELHFVPIPHNENYELDLHKPYIDEINLLCECGGNLTRTKEVMDVWFDSGAMPFAQDHYPFENKEWVDGKGYPADFISEAIDQTRGWFYTLHAVGVLMGRGKAYKNVICLGHLLDAKGKKMSKSLGNVVDPWEAMSKYGVDTLRLWMYSVNQPGESKNFDEKTVLELHRQVFGLLYNVLAFYELYRDPQLEILEHKKSENILDKWVVARLNELIKISTENLDNYKLLEPTRAIRDFIGDLSTWYLRRSRDRIKDGEKEAKQTLYFVLKTITKLLAPFAPFAAEDIWLKLKTEKDVESVHLVQWPETGAVDEKIIEEMKKVREIVTIGLAKRQEYGLKVKQPLSEIFYFFMNSKKLSFELEQLIKEELNVKNVIWTENTPLGNNIDYSGSGEIKVAINNDITSELKEEGNYREFVRAIQDMRKENNFTPSDSINITGITGPAGENLINKYGSKLKKDVNANKIKIGPNGPVDGKEIKIDELMFKVKIEK